MSCTNFKQDGHVYRCILRHPLVAQLRVLDNVAEGKVTKELNEIQARGGPAEMEVLHLAHLALDMTNALPHGNDRAKKQLSWYNGVRRTQLLGDRLLLFPEDPTWAMDDGLFKRDGPDAM
ncbi:predicted protein [Plenodomus lingam JN3]|uniref:Predicted protein n=1 Tax=Leptosphaeria maculans (strain JN3 / isolate v23.1.3 / race Av1-4-5-6-7-8) TaxID=985895 RepID=E4ZZQ2_LEPMJ|nr:predicted protein [Plenodomus lingam JN3]CBX97168.1 predicted protein [Plenodomus lingam JN3]